MDDSLGPRVRNAAVQLAVTVYQTFGKDAVKPLLANLRPAKQALLKKTFEESEENEGLGMSDEGGCDELSLDGKDIDLSGLIVHGRSVGLLQQCEPELPGAIGGAHDELFMDGILEEAGVVFNGSGIIQEGEERVSPRFGSSPENRLLEEDEWEDYVANEEESRKPRDESRGRG